MERESFESAAIADIMNKHFVSVKVDREERCACALVVLHGCVSAIVAIMQSSATVIKRLCRCCRTDVDRVYVRFTAYFM